MCMGVCLYVGWTIQRTMAKGRCKGRLVYMTYSVVGKKGGDGGRLHMQKQDRWPVCLSFSIDRSGACAGRWT